MLEFPEHLIPGYFQSYLQTYIERERNPFPIEIKMKSNPSPRDLKGGGSFKKCFPHEPCHTGLVICSIASPQTIPEDVFAIPWWML